MKAEKSVAPPIIKQCAHCHSLGHESTHCHIKCSVTICTLCGKTHHTKDHHLKCTNAFHHGSITCNCLPKCINCEAASKSFKGHTAIDLSCPLQKAFCNPTNCLGVSLDEEATTITCTVSAFETAHSVPGPTLIAPNTPLTEADGTCLASAKLGGVPSCGGDSVPRSHAKSQEMAPTRPACIDDNDVPMQPASNNSSDPFRHIYEMFSTEEKVYPGHP
jgi:hypothetical protein